MDTANQLSPVKRAILEMRELRAALDEQERRVREPIAIVGIGCRYPGGIDSPEAFWRLLRDGIDAVSEIPPDRWSADAFYDADPDAPGKMSTRWGGFVQNVDRFDAEFFGIAPREAVTLDPQQRLLLEVSWEALEHAGIAPESLFGSQSGVFVGIGSFDYSQLHLREASAEAIDAYLATGSSHSIASGRLSYLFGFQGPSVSIDTACSSSLVAVHLAAQALRARDCDLAVAGGVNVILMPEILINFSKARMMASDGRCKTFDAAADGFVRSEGCGIVILKRLSDALRDRDRILAVIRGTAVNQDGRSSGLTAPSGPSQQAVIRRALANANIDPADVDYVEAHGTGTSLGDPIEVQALGEVFAKSAGRPAPLLIGSVKTNLGHCEAAAGVAGLIKVALAMQAGEIPPHLHFRAPSPHIPWSELNIDVPTVRTPWTPRRDRRIGAVSSFGFSGTNAHVVLEEAPEPTIASRAPERPQHLVVLSARSDLALRELADRMSAALARRPGDALGDAGFTTNAGRAHFSCRLAVRAATASEAARALSAFAAGEKPPGVRTGTVDAPAPPEAVFLFTGQGSQYSGMGEELFNTQPTFRDCIQRCDAFLRERYDVRLRSLLFDGDRAELLNETGFTQPVLFALQYALATLWRSWGVEPVAVLGHSVGELAAACTAGVFSVEDGLMLAAERGRLMQALCSRGAMAAVLGVSAVVTEQLEEPGINVAALNGPSNTVIAGALTDIEAAVVRLEAAGVRCKRLQVSHAFHSPLMEPMLDEFARVAGRVKYSAPAIPLVSNVHGRVFAPGEIPDAQYWRRHAREPVRFAAGFEALSARGHRHFVEIGPGQTLLGMAREVAAEDEAVWLPSLRPGQCDWVQMLDAAAALYVAGVHVDWAGFDRDYDRRRIALPTYPFQRKRYWVNARPGIAEAHEPERRWSKAVAAGTQQAALVPIDLDLSRYEAKWAALDRVVPAVITRALHELGAFGAAGETLCADDLIARFGVLPTYRHLLGRWLRRLERDGLLVRCGDGWQATAPLPNPSVEAAAAAGREVLADTSFLLEYVVRCGALMSAVLTGKESPLETLFPGGSSETAVNIYHRWALSRYYNAISRSVVSAYAAERSRGAALRVLEVGAGTGGTTAAVLPALPADSTTYVYTDVSEFFFDQASRQFHEYPFVRYRRLDIEQAPQEQGFGRHEYDIVVAANVLHATRDLARTLDHVHSLLRPGGLLLLYEVTNPPAWFDVTIALIEGWQRFDDGLRADGPLLACGDWKRLLQARRFEEVASMPEAGSPAEILTSHVILARARGGAARPAATVRETASLTPAGHAHAAEPAPGLGQRIADAPRAERDELLVEYVRSCVMQVLRREASSPVARHDKLMDIGVDSLMAVELRNLLSAGLQLPARLPATLMFDHPTISAIATYLGALHERVRPADARQEDVATPVTAAARLDGLSDAEVEALLIEKLDQL